MRQQSMVGLLRVRGCRLWQGRRLHFHKGSSPKTYSCGSSHSTTKAVWRHVCAERGEERIAGKGSVWPSKGFLTASLELKMNHMQAHIPFSCTPSGQRLFSSFENYEHLTLDMQAPSAAMDMTEVETDTALSERVEDFDFRNFPALTSSFFQGYERPSELQRRKKRVVFQSDQKLFETGSKLTEESIPQPKGLMYDFGLEVMPTMPPPLEVGARPQGRFDIDISLDNCEEGSSESPLKSPVLSQRVTMDAPGTDYLTQVSRNPRKTEDGVSDAEQESWWDPYDFDAEMDVPHKLETEE